MRKLKHSTIPAVAWAEESAPLWREHKPLVRHPRRSRVYWVRVGKGPASPVLSLPCSLPLGDLEQSILLSLPLNFLNAKMASVLCLWSRVVLMFQWDDALRGVLKAVKSCPGTTLSLRGWEERGGGESSLSTLEVCQFYWSFQRTSFLFHWFPLLLFCVQFHDFRFYFYFVLPPACFLSLYSLSFF